MESHDIIVQYFGGTLLTFYTESRQDDITSKNRTRFEWADEVGVVTKFSKRLFVPREFDMKRVPLELIRERFNTINPKHICP